MMSAKVETLGIYRLLEKEFSDEAPEGLFDYAPFREAMNHCIQLIFQGSRPSPEGSAPNTPEQDEQYAQQLSESTIPVLDATKKYMDILYGDNESHIEQTGDLVAAVFEETTDICAAKNMRTSITRDGLN